MWCLCLDYTIIGYENIRKKIPRKLFLKKHFKDIQTKTNRLARVPTCPPEPPVCCALPQEPKASFSHVHMPTSGGTQQGNHGNHWSTFCMNKSINTGWKTFQSTVLFPSLKLGILIIYFHQAVGKAYIIDEIMFYRDSEFLALSGLSSSLHHGEKKLQKNLLRFQATVIMEE